MLPNGTTRGRSWPSTQMWLRRQSLQSLLQSSRHWHIIDIISTNILETIKNHDAICKIWGRGLSSTVTRECLASEDQVAGNFIQWRGASFCWKAHTLQANLLTVSAQCPGAHNNWIHIHYIYIICGYVRHVRFPASWRHWWCVMGAWFLFKVVLLAEHSL